MSQVTSQTGFPYRANHGVWTPRLGASVRSIQSRPDLPLTSIANTALADNAPLYGAGNFQSALTLVAGLTTTSSPVASQFNVPYSIPTQQDDYTCPIYVLPSSAPRTGVYMTNTAIAWQSVCNSVPVPNPAYLPGGQIQSNGGDGACLFMCDDEMWEFWEFSPAAPGSTAALAGFSWQAASVGYTSHLSTFNGFYPSPPSWGVHAAGNSWLMGLLRAEDWIAGTISHVVSIGFPCVGAPSGAQFRAPATRCDTGSTLVAGGHSVDNYMVPEGSWFRLPHTFDTEAWAAANNGENGTAVVVEMVCRAIRDYGLFIDDGSGSMNFCTEGSQSFGSPYNPYGGFPGYYFGMYLPWSQMVQLAPRAAF